MDTLLLVHNFYQQPGGEDRIFAGEADLLEEHGHRVIRYTVHNDAVDALSGLQLAKAILWNSDVCQELRKIVRQERPQVVHFHNTFPLISPAAYHAIRDEGIPVVQTLHNYRLFCLNGCFFRDGHVCEDCFGKTMPWPGVVHACYRSNYLASGGTAAMLTLHRALRTWKDKVNVFIAYSRFAQEKFIEGGLPAEKMAFKTNFLSPVPSPGEGDGDYALFVGRLTPEKGLRTLISAWKQLGSRLALKIVGDGPLAPEVAEAAAHIPGIAYLGWQTPKEVSQLMSQAYALVFPSEWYETFGRVGMEALAVGTPLVAADIGAVAELVDHQKTGMLFRAGDAEDLVKQVRWMLEHPDKLAHMRLDARIDFENKYMPERNYQELIGIYERAAQSVVG